MARAACKPGRNDLLFDPRRRPREPDTRRGYYLDVQTWYHLQVFIPLLQQFLPDDPAKGAPWIRLPGRMTVVIN